MEKRGLGALEMLAMELKSKGSYVSRGLGWKGAEFETCEVSGVSRARLCLLSSHQSVISTRGHLYTPVSVLTLHLYLVQICVHRL